jgi:hypothetical protein
MLIEDALIGRPPLTWAEQADRLEAVTAGEIRCLLRCAAPLASLVGPLKRDSLVAAWAGDPP